MRRIGNVRLGMSAMVGRLITIGCVLALGLVGPALAAPSDGGLEDVAAKYFRELRQRRLFKLAESYCHHRLSQPGLSSGQAADLTLELVRTLTEHATYVDVEEQQELWKQALQTLDEFLKQNPAHPRRLVLEVQGALVPAAEGHWYRWQTELQPYDSDTSRRAATALNLAIGRLRTLDAQVAEQLRRTTAGKPSEPGGLKGFELRTLLHNVRFRLAVARLDLAHVLPEDSADRSAMLLDAQKTLKPMSDIPDDTDLAWNVRVALVECSRLLGDSLRTLRDLDALDKVQPPAAFADRLLAERVRVLMREKKFLKGISLLDERAERGTPPGELAFLGVQLLGEQLLAEVASPGNRSPTGSLKSLEERALRVRQEVGGFWGYRAELVLQQVRDQQNFGPELTSLMRRAQAEFTHGRLPEAIAAYGKAAATAHRAGRGDLAFQLGLTRGSIEIQAQHWSEAAADLLELVEQFPDDPKAAEAHLLSAYALGRLFDQKPGKSRRQEYEQILESHRARYAGHPTAGDATWMLAELSERRGQFTVALSRYREIPWEHKRAAAAQVAIARCHEKILDRLRELKEPTEAWERDAITELQKLLPSAATASRAYDPPQAEVALRLARILLRRREPDYVVADRLLTRVLLAVADQGPAPAPDGPAVPADQEAVLRAQAMQLRIVSLAGQGRFPEARNLLEQLSATSPAELLRILQGLTPLSSDDQHDPLRDLAELQVQAALKLNNQRDELTPADRRRLDECLARGYAAAGDRDRSVEIYESLLKGTPRDARLLRDYAGVLVRCGTRECFEKALAAWKKLESMHPAGSEEWLLARLQVCRFLVASQHTVDAQKLLKVTRLLYPKLGNDRLKLEFDELEALAGKRPATTAP